MVVGCVWIGYGWCAAVAGVRWLRWCLVCSGRGMCMDSVWLVCCCGRCWVVGGLHCSCWSGRWGTPLRGLETGAGVPFGGCPSAPSNLFPALPRGARRASKNVSPPPYAPSSSSALSSTEPPGLLCFFLSLSCLLSFSLSLSPSISLSLTPLTISPSLSFPFT